MQNLSRRWGRFRLSGHSLLACGFPAEDSPYYESLLALQGQVLIIEARHAPYDDSIEYLGISILFDELKEGEDPPWYGLEGQILEEEVDCSRCNGRPMDPRCHLCGGGGRIRSCRYEVKAFRRIK